MTQTIKQLDSITINKIAAGEVIDRPVSIVKELIENSLDSGASEVIIDVKDGGKQSIIITDNGQGFNKDDLPLAPVRHATSKINTLNDIYGLDTFGFRGEALSSICHCATLVITSKKESSPAYSIKAYQDDIHPVRLASHPQGTTIEVHDLFLDMPVRRKFLKSASTELSYIVECCVHFALIHPEKSFILRSNDIEKVNSTGITSMHDLLIHFYGKSLKGKLAEVDCHIGPIHFTGIISDPTLTFSNRQKQVMAVNQRLVKNSALLKSLSTSYKDNIPAKRFPLAILNLSIQSSELDVNIHPQKHDIKFISPGFLFDALPKAISISLQSHTSHVNPLVSPASLPVNLSTVSSSDQSSVIPFSHSVISTMPSKDTMEQGFSVLNQPLSQDNTILDTSFSNLEFLQILDTYIILKVIDGIYMIDQHAVHERILYEKIKDTFAQQSARQVLLLAEVVDVSPDLMDIFDQNIDYFEHLNFITEPFGTSQIVIREIPVAFEKAKLSELFLSILSQLKAFPGSTRNLALDQKETLQRQACKAAIKAGQKMSDIEIKQLLKDFIQTPQNFTCPHGRPLFIHYDKHKLETLFLRK